MLSKKNKPKLNLRILHRNNMLFCNESPGFNNSRNNAERLPTFIKKKETKNKSQSEQYFQEDSDESSYEKV